MVLSDYDIPMAKQRPFYLSLCVIVKNEARYLVEWIEFHRMVGVQRFHIYDNNSTDNITEVLAPYIKEGVVEYIPWPGQKRQLPAYMHCNLTKQRTKP